MNTQQALEELRKIHPKGRFNVEIKRSYDPDKGEIRPPEMVVFCHREFMDCLHASAASFPRCIEKLRPALLVLAAEDRKDPVNPSELPADE